MSLLLQSSLPKDGGRGAEERHERTKQCCNNVRESQEILPSGGNLASEDGL